MQREPRLIEVFARLETSDVRALAESGYPIGKVLTGEIDLENRQQVEEGEVWQFSHVLNVRRRDKLARLMS